MKDLTKYYIDLSKLSEEQIKALPQILEKAGEILGDQMDINGEDLSYWNNLHKPDYATYWTVGTSNSTPEKQELTYPEFIKLFEGGEEKSDLEVWLNRQIENCQQLDMPREKWAYIQVLKKINSNQ